jgi:hypothetical protein
MIRGMTIGERAMVLLPGVLALFPSALLSGVAAESTIPRTAPAATTNPSPHLPERRPQIEFWINAFTQLQQHGVLPHDTRFPRVCYEVFTPL